jgi:hypothetical protein
MYDMKVTRDFAGMSFKRGCGAALRITATERRRIRVVERNADGAFRCRNRILPTGTHVVPSAFKRAECAEVLVSDIGPA